MQDNPKHGEGASQTECCGESPHQHIKKRGPLLGLYYSTGLLYYNIPRAYSGGSLFLPPPLNLIPYQILDEMKRKVHDSIRFIIEISRGDRHIETHMVGYMSSIVTDM